MLLNGEINMFAWSITVPILQWFEQINLKLACIFVITGNKRRSCANCSQKRRKRKGRKIGDKSQHENTQTERKRCVKNRRAHIQCAQFVDLHNWIDSNWIESNQMKFSRTFFKCAILQPHHTHRQRDLNCVLAFSCSWSWNAISVSLIFDKYTHKSKIMLAVSHIFLLRLC